MTRIGREPECIYSIRVIRAIRGRFFGLTLVVLETQLDLHDGVMHIADCCGAMAAEIVLGFFQLPMGVLAFVEGVMQVRMMFVLPIDFLQVAARRSTLDVIAGVFQGEIDLLDRIVDSDQGLFAMAAEIVLGFLEFLVGVTQLPERVVKMVVRVRR
jgi:hypothetical protein